MPQGLQVRGVDSQELQQALAFSMATDGAQSPAAPALQATTQSFDAVPVNSEAVAEPATAALPLAAEQAVADVPAEAPSRSPADKATVESASRKAAAEAQPTVPSACRGLIGGEQPGVADERQTASSEGAKGEQEGEWVKIAAAYPVGETSLKEGFQDDDDGDAEFASSSGTRNPGPA